MKKLIIFFILFFSIGFIKANPIPPPPIISEFYIVNDSTWYVELVFSSSYYTNTNLNGFRIESSSGIAYIKHGISVTLDSIIVLTQDSMVSPLYFDRNNDYINFEDSLGYPYDGIYFTNNSWYAPSYGQSLVRYVLDCWDYNENAPSTQILLVKDNNPTIGYDPFTGSSCHGIFTGIVYDNGHNPVPGIHVGNNLYYLAPSYACGNYFSSPVTDSSGVFSAWEYSISFNVKLFYEPSGLVMMDSVIYIEPDSTNYYEFTIDTLLTGLHINPYQTTIALSTFPSPSNGETTISFSIPSGRYFSKALIKIYDSNGEIVKIIPVNTNDPQNKYSVKWDGLCGSYSAASGIYYCNLELDGQKIATDKIIIAK